MNYIVTPDILSIVSKEGEEFNIPISYSQYYQLISQAYTLKDISDDRVMWSDPVLMVHEITPNFVLVVKEICINCRKDVSQWLS